MNMTRLSLLKLPLFLCIFVGFSCFGNTPPTIQLATNFKLPENATIKNYWISEKLDGVRGYWDGKHLYTRKGHRIKTPDFFTNDWPTEPMDGELWISRNSFHLISSLVRTKRVSDKKWRNVKFMVFDLPRHQGKFTNRISVINSLIEKHQSSHLKAVKQFKIENMTALEAKLTAIVQQGAEGLMLHHEDAYYSIGRSKNIMKLKPYYDDEAKVIRVVPGKGKYQNMMGALLVETPGGKRFKIGTGFSDAEREFPPSIGSVITYKYSGKTHLGMPRFASFLRIRTP